MSTTQKPDALRLAEILDKYALNPLREVAAELRSQHARIAELEEQLSVTQPAAHGMDAETQRHAAIGKAIERACADLPEETEIIVSLEKGAGTVKLIDQGGNEHESFSCDYGFAAVLDEAVDAAIAAQTKQ